MKRKLTLLITVMVIAFLGLAVTAFAQEASVFGDGVLIRAYINQLDSAGEACVGGGYSAYLEVRDDEGVPLEQGEFHVNGVMGTSDPVTANDTNPVQIHDCNLTTQDLSVSYDSITKTVYIFCISDSHGLHVMTYDIGLTTPVVNGVCGPSDGESFTQAPTSGLCSSGTETSVSGSGPWTWSCLGSDGGADANCSANLRVDGACGPSDGQSFTQAPTSGLCNSGTPSAVSGSGPWTWACQGSYGGSTVNCSAQLQQGFPDLTVSVGSWPSSYNVGSSFSIRVTVNNGGEANAGPFSVKVTQNGGVVGSWSLGGGLAAGGSTTDYISVSPNSSCAIHSWCRFVVTADKDEQVAESNESNNSTSRSLYRGR